MTLSPTYFKMNMIYSQSDMKYELITVLPGDTTPAKKKSATAKIEKIVNILEGKIDKVNDWGKKELAYPIKKNNSGVFLIFDLELSAKAAKELLSKLRIEEELIRHLLIKQR